MEKDIRFGDVIVTINASDRKAMCDFILELSEVYHYASCDMEFHRCDTQAEEYHRTYMNLFDEYVMENNVVE